MAQNPAEITQEEILHAAMRMYAFWREAMEKYGVKPPIWRDLTFEERSAWTAVQLGVMRDIAAAIGGQGWKLG